MQMIAEFILPTDPRWTEVLREARHDVYHLPEYTAFAAAHEGGRPVAFYARDDRGAMLAPLLVRPIPGPIAGAESLFDASSPYGYPGPVVTDPGNADAIASYLDAFGSVGSEAGIIAAFFRLHPLLDLPHHALAQHGRVTVRGQTVPIPLTQSVEAIRADTRANHRTGVRKLLAAGYTATMDDWSSYAEFSSLYRETMHRVGASDFYLFSDAYFADLRAALGERLHLCTVRSPDGELASAGVFTTASGIVQYHLGGTASAFLGAAPSKVMFDHVRLWARAAGFTVLHLGGGLGGRSDSLFNFKAGFASARATFATYATVLDAERYTVLTARAEQSGGTPDPDFFPLYRAPRRAEPLLETVS